MTQTQAQVFRRAALDHVLGFDVAFPLFAVAGGARVGAATGDITGHEAQARNAEGCHVDVITRLVGLFAFGVEVGTGDGVGQEHSAAAVYAVTVVAVTGDFLGCQGEGVSTDGVRALQAEGAVVELGHAIFLCALQAGAVALGVVDVEVQGERLIIAQGVGPVQVAVVLAEVIFGFRVVQAAGDFWSEGIHTADKVGFGQAQAVVVGLVLRDAGSEVTAFKLQALDFVAGDGDTLRQLWQQAAVVGGKHWGCGVLVTDFQHCVGDAELHRAAAFGVVVLRATIGTGWEQAGAGAALAAVELDAHQADHVDTDTNGALGEARFVQGIEAQAGFFSTALGAWARRVVTEVTAEVQRASIDAERTVFNKALGIVLGGRHCELRGAC